MDRIAEHIRLIDYRLQVIEAGNTDAREVFERNARSEYGTSIIEDSVIQSARTVEPESREHIAALVVRSMTDEELQHERTQKLLNIYNELTYPEIIWLLYFHYVGLSDASKKPHQHFAEKHAAIINEKTRPKPTLHSSQRSRGLAVRLTGQDDESALNESYLSTLARLNLVEESSGRILGRYRVTRLGTLLVRRIVLPADTEDSRF